MAPLLWFRGGGVRAYADDDRVERGEDANHSYGLACGIMKIY